MAVGSLQVFSDAGASLYTFQFVNITFPGGWPENSLQRVGEPITAMGVDGTRARWVRKDLPVFQVDTMSENATFAGAVAEATSMRDYKLFTCLFTVIAAGTTYTFTRKAYIWDVRAKPVRADVVCTTGAIAAPQAVVTTSWTLQFIPAP